MAGDIPVNDQGSHGSENGCNELLNSSDNSTTQLVGSPPGESSISVPGRCPKEAQEEGPGQTLLIDTEVPTQLEAYDACRSTAEIEEAHGFTLKPHSYCEDSGRTELLSDGESGDLHCITSGYEKHQECSSGSKGEKLSLVSGNATGNVVGAEDTLDVQFTSVGIFDTRKALGARNSPDREILEEDTSSKTGIVGCGGEDEPVQGALLKIVNSDASTSEGEETNEGNLETMAESMVDDRGFQNGGSLAGSCGGMLVHNSSNAREPFSISMGQMNEVQHSDKADAFEMINLEKDLSKSPKDLNADQKTDSTEIALKLPASPLNVEDASHSTASPEETPKTASATVLMIKNSPCMSTSRSKSRSIASVRAASLHAAGLRAAARNASMSLAGSENADKYDSGATIDLTSEGAEGPNLGSQLLRKLKVGCTKLTDIRTSLASLTPDTSSCKVGNAFPAQPNIDGDAEGVRLSQNLAHESVKLKGNFIQQAGQSVRKLFGDIEDELGTRCRSSEGKLPTGENAEESHKSGPTSPVQMEKVGLSSKLEKSKLELKDPLQTVRFKDQKCYGSLASGLVSVCTDMSYLNSQEPGEESQANALNMVDKLLWLNTTAVSQDSDLDIAKDHCCVEGPQSAKGVYSLAHNAEAKMLQDQMGVFDWVDSQHEEVESPTGNSKDDTKVLGSFKKLPKARKVSKVRHRMTGPHKGRLTNKRSEGIVIKEKGKAFGSFQVKKQPPDRSVQKPGFPFDSKMFLSDGNASHSLLNGKELNINLHHAPGQNDVALAHNNNSRDANDQPTYCERESSRAFDIGSDTQIAMEAIQMMNHGVQEKEQRESKCHSNVSISFQSTVPPSQKPGFIKLRKRSIEKNDTKYEVKRRKTQKTGVRNLKNKIPEVVSEVKVRRRVSWAGDVEGLHKEKTRERKNTPGLESCKKAPRTRLAKRNIKNQVDVIDGAAGGDTVKNSRSMKSMRGKRCKMVAMQIEQIAPEYSPSATPAVPLNSIDALNKELSGLKRRVTRQQSVMDVCGKDAKNDAIQDQKTGKVSPAVTLVMGETSGSQEGKDTKNQTRDEEVRVFKKKRQRREAPPGISGKPLDDGTIKQSKKSLFDLETQNGAGVKDLNGSPILLAVGRSTQRITRSTKSSQPSTVATRENRRNSKSFLSSGRNEENLDQVDDRKHAVRPLPFKQLTTPTSSVVTRRGSKGSSSVQTSENRQLNGLGVPMHLHLSPVDGRRKKREPGNVRVLFSHSLHEDIVKHQKKILAKLGGQVAVSAADCTHFVADSFVRTRNMLEAMASGKAVVTSLWLESCGQVSYFIDEKNYILQDAKKEKELSFSMHSSLAAAQQKPLLKGMKAIISPNTTPDTESMAAIVQAAGGQVVDTFGPSSVDTCVGDEDPLCILISCEKDSKFCLPFLEKGVKVYSTELLLTGILLQELDFSRHQLFEKHCQQRRLSKRSVNFQK